MESLSHFITFFFQKYERNNDTKNKKATKTFPKKKKKNGAGFPFVCICGSNMRLKFQIETCKIEPGIAVMPHVFVTTCLMYIESFLGDIC